GKPCRVAPISNNQHFGRPGYKVDRRIPRDHALGGGNISISWPDNFLDRCDRSGAIGQSANRLSAADGVNLLDPQSLCHSQRFRHRPWSAYHDARDTGDLGRNGSHQQRGGQWVTAGRNVAANAFERPDQLADADSSSSAAAPWPGHLEAAKRAD